MTGEEIEALAALDQAATPGPWSVREDADGDIMITASSKYGQPWNVAEAFDGAGDAQPLDNATLIVAMRNALPALLADVARLTRERDEARAALKPAQRILADLVNPRSGFSVAHGYAEVRRVELLLRTALSTPASGER